MFQPIQIETKKLNNSQIEPYLDNIQQLIRYKLKLIRERLNWNNNYYGMYKNKFTWISSITTKAIKN